MIPPPGFEELAGRLAAAGREARITMGRTTVERWGSIGQAVEVREGTALVEAPPITVYFDQRGRIVGWLDHGRSGSSDQPDAGPAGVREAVIRELDLGPGTRIGTVRVVLLPPVGWTLEVGVFPGPEAFPARAVRVWLEPGSLRIIQARFDPSEVAR